MDEFFETCSECRCDVTDAEDWDPDLEMCTECAEEEFFGERH